MAYILSELCYDWWEARSALYLRTYGARPLSPKVGDVIPYLIRKLQTCYQVAKELRCNASSVRWWLEHNGWEQDEQGNWQETSNATKKEVSLRHARRPGAHRLRKRTGAE